MDIAHLETPFYLMEEAKLERNLQLLARVQRESGARILLALKGFAFSGGMEMVGRYLQGCCASGLHEARYGAERIGGEVHTYAPAFKAEEIDEIIDLSHHLVFNSFAQWKRFRDRAVGRVSCGLRINPECSAAPTESYNPCAPFSRLGITHAQFEAALSQDSSLLEGIEGLHFHALCEEGADALAQVLEAFEAKFGRYISRMRWINFGGGHHITKRGYDLQKLIDLIRDFRARYGVEVYLEPGEAVGWETGVLVASVLDIVHNGIDIAILDTSAEAHMPDTILMPYRAEVRGAAPAGEKPYTYRLAGNTCLAGDVMGDYAFDRPLRVGDRIIFEDQIHYTIVKNTTFNGIKLPNLVLLKRDGTTEVVRRFGYAEYARRN